MGSDGPQSVQLGLSRVQRMAHASVREWGSNRSEEVLLSGICRKEEKNHKLTDTKKPGSSLYFPSTPTSGAAEQGCHLKHILCSVSKMMLFLANIGIVALSPGREVTE